MAVSIKIQYAIQDETHPLAAKQCLNIQKVTGSILYYARAADPTVFIPLNDIATEQTKATDKTQAATNQLLDYLLTHPDATIRYHASGMILQIHSDTSYLSVSNARSGQIAFRLCEGVLNYSHSCNPTCIRAQTHIHIQAPRERLISRVCWSMFTLYQYRT
jgi:hypothetical protein